MTWRHIVLALALVAWAILPLLLPRNLVDLLVFAGIYTVAGLGVGLLLGHCGIVNLAQAVFYGIGAYSTAYLTVEAGLPSVTGFVVGALLSMAVALTLGWPILRLTGYFLALATMALGIIGNALFYEWDCHHRWHARDRRHPQARGVRLCPRYAAALLLPRLAGGVRLHAARGQSRAQPHRPDVPRHARLRARPP